MPVFLCEDGENDIMDEGGLYVGKSNDLRCNVKMIGLDMLVPAGHLLWKIESAIDLSEIYGWSNILLR